MTYRVKTTDAFEKQAERLIKKYSSLKFELLELIQNLKENPIQGKPIGKGCYKIRIQIKSKGKGKRSGGRIITNIIIRSETVYLLSVYDKLEKENLTDKELEKLLGDIPE